MSEGFDHTSDYEQGREDARNGFPRASTRAFYRQGYDRGLSESIQPHSQEFAAERDPTQGGIWAIEELVGDDKS